MTQRFEAISVAGFIQQLAVAYVAHGYRYFAVRVFPKKKDPARIDERLRDVYELELSKWQRARRKQKGLANVGYIRHGHFAVLIATPQTLGGGGQRAGGHKFFTECRDYRDIRRHAIRYGGYSVSSKYCSKTGRFHASVRIEREQFRRLKAHLGEVAVRRTREELEDELGSLRFEPYAPIARQYLDLLRHVNKKRGAAGLELVSDRCLRLNRRSIPVFGSKEAA